MNSVDVSSLMSVFSHGHDFVLIKLFWLVASFSVCVYIVCVCVCLRAMFAPLCYGILKKPGVIFAHTRP